MIANEISRKKVFDIEKLSALRKEISLVPKEPYEYVELSLFDVIDNEEEVLRTLNPFGLQSEERINTIKEIIAERQQHATKTDWIDNDLGSGYDAEDPFIDDSEAHVDNSIGKTLYGGFYINKGDVELNEEKETSSPVTNGTSSVNNEGSSSSTVDNNVLPADLTEEAKENIHEFVSLCSSFEDKVKLWRSPIAINLLLNIDKALESGSVKRRQVLNHISNALQIQKASLLKRLRKLRNSNNVDNKLTENLNALKCHINATIPAQIADYERQLSVISGEQRENDKIKRKRYKWSTIARTMVREIIGTVAKKWTNNETESLEDFLRAYLEANVKVLWPKGWITTSSLMKECRFLLHNNNSNGIIDEEGLANKKRKMDEMNKNYSVECNNVKNVDLGRSQDVQRVQIPVNVVDDKLLSSTSSSSSSLNAADCKEQRVKAVVCPVAGLSIGSPRESSATAAAGSCSTSSTGGGGVVKLVDCSGQIKAMNNAVKQNDDKNSIKPLDLPTQKLINLQKTPGTVNLASCRASYCNNEKTEPVPALNVISENGSKRKPPSDIPLELLSSGKNLIDEVYGIRNCACINKSGELEVNASSSSSKKPFMRCSSNAVEQQQTIEPSLLNAKVLVETNNKKSNSFKLQSDNNNNNCEIIELCAKEYYNGKGVQNSKKSSFSELKKFENNNNESPVLLQNRWSSYTIRTKDNRRSPPCIILNDVSTCLSKSNTTVQITNGMMTSSDALKPHVILESGKTTTTTATTALAAKLCPSNSSADKCSAAAVSTATVMNNIDSIISESGGCGGRVNLCITTQPCNNGGGSESLLSHSSEYLDLNKIKSFNVKSNGGRSVQSSSSHCRIIRDESDNKEVKINQSVLLAQSPKQQQRSRQLTLQSQQQGNQHSHQQLLSPAPSQPLPSAAPPPPKVKVVLSNNKQEEVKINIQDDHHRTTQFKNSSSVIGGGGGGGKNNEAVATTSVVNEHERLIKQRLTNRSSSVILEENVQQQPQQQCKPKQKTCKSVKQQKGNSSSSQPIFQQGKQQQILKPDVIRTNNTQQNPKVNTTTTTSTSCQQQQQTVNVTQRKTYGTKQSPSIQPDIVDISGRNILDGSLAYQTNANTCVQFKVSSITSNLCKSTANSVTDLYGNQRMPTYSISYDSRVKPRLEMSRLNFSNALGRPPLNASSINMKRLNDASQIVLSEVMLRKNTTFKNSSIAGISSAENGLPSIQEITSFKNNTSTFDNNDVEILSETCGHGKQPSMQQSQRLNGTPKSDNNERYSNTKESNNGGCAEMNGLNDLTSRLSSTQHVFQIYGGSEHNNKSDSNSS